MKNSSWQSAPYLDALRPEPGWRVEHAVIATYSADLVAVVAAMLALAGLDDDRGSGSKVDFANAYERTRGRFRVLAQVGRVASPGSAASILAIIDQFIREISADEHVVSWHAKAALVKFSNPMSKASEWRLWLGSRNLTRDMSWDTGLILVSTSDEDGRHIPGAADLASALHLHAQLPGLEASEVAVDVSKLRWRMPPGYQVEEIRYLHPEMQDRAFPQAPEHVNQLLVVSPFIDGKAVSHFGGWGTIGCERWLLSTQDQLARLALQEGQPLGHYSQLFSMDSPEVEPGYPLSPGDSNTAEAVEDPDEEPAPRGLHAKIVAARVGKSWALWFGSVNVTSRGWRSNYEIVVRMTTDSDGIKGLLQLFGEIAKIVDVDGLPLSASEQSQEDILEEARKALVAGWVVRQRRGTSGPMLTADVPPPLGNAGISMKAGLLGSKLLAWPNESSRLQLPPVDGAAETELVEFVLVLGNLESRWIQRISLTPPPADDRDRQAIARYLDPKTFLGWIREVLNDYRLDDGGGSWNGSEPSSHGARRSISATASWTPTLEEILRAWARDPHAIRDADSKIQQYLHHYRRNGAAHVEDQQVQAILREFEDVWKIVRRELLAERAL
jgi:hypothetical protein